MCGIIGYTGRQQASPILLDGLKRLEYRGYDSAGIGVIHDRIRLVKALGPIAKLEEAIKFGVPNGSCGVAHTRWATHGSPSKVNAHPHIDCMGAIAVVHNGIIENYQSLRCELTLSGHIFRSQTDSEVISHLLEEALREETTLRAAFDRMLERLTGAYGIVAVF